MGLGFPVQVFIPHIGTSAWTDDSASKQELVLGAGYGGFFAGVVWTGGKGELDRYLMTSLEMANNFLRACTPFVIEPDTWPIVFAPDVVRAYAGNSATVRLLVHRATKELVGYLTIAKE